MISVVNYVNLRFDALRRSLTFQIMPLGISKLQKTSVVVKVFVENP